MLSLINIDSNEEFIKILYKLDNKKKEELEIRKINEKEIINVFSNDLVKEFLKNLIKQDREFLTN